MQTAVPAGTAVFREKWKRTDSRFAAFGERGGASLPFLRTEMPLRDIPVFRMAYFTIKPYYGLISKTLMLQVRFAHPSMGGGSFAPPLHPPLPPPLFIGRFAAFDRQIPKEDVFIPPNAAFAQLSLAHSAAFCYSFLNNRTRCGKRRLLP